MEHVGILPLGFSSIVARSHIQKSFWMIPITNSSVLSRKLIVHLELIQIPITEEVLLLSLIVKVSILLGHKQSINLLVIYQKVSFV